jgi:hypothetical protein
LRSELGGIKKFGELLKALSGQRQLLKQQLLPSVSRFKLFNKKLLLYRGVENASDLGFTAGFH